MKHSDEIWVVGYLGKKNQVYFTQHYVPNKNVDQIIEINNYIIQSSKLSAIAKNEVEKDRSVNIGYGIWITMDLLLLFLNLSLFFRMKNK